MATISTEYYESIVIKWASRDEMDIPARNHDKPSGVVSSRTDGFLDTQSRPITIPNRRMPHESTVCHGSGLP